MATNSFGHYELRELLGRGGMGQVYRAYDSATDRVVALKVLPPHMAEDSEFQQRFRREARIAASLNDPHVVPIHNYGEIDGRLYVDMRLIEGRDLEHYLAEHGGQLSPQRTVGVIEQVASALETAREQGLIHRDIKPSNILVTTTRDFVYLIDFGIARAAADTSLTHTGHTMGTVAYMAPERFRGSTDHRADVYSLACVMYECLTGRRPYPGDSFEEQLNGHLNTPPPRASQLAPWVPPDLDEVVARGMAKDPDQRYQTAIDLADAARAALANPYPANPGPPQPYAAQAYPPASAAAAQPAVQLAPQTPAAATSNRKMVLGVVGGSIFALVAVVVLVIALTTHSQSSSPNSAASSTPTRARVPKPTVTAQAPATATVPALPAFAPPADPGANCQYTTAPDPSVKPVNPPVSGRVSSEPPVIKATIFTNFGDIGVELTNARTPCTVNSFVYLAQEQFFNNTECGRLTVAQDAGGLLCGGPDKDGTGGPGYEFVDEYPMNQYPPGDPALRANVLYPRGTLTMADFGGPNQNGSQFVLFTRDTPSTPTSTVFGTVDDAGLVVLDKISAAGVAGHRDSGLPINPVTISSVRID